MTDQDNNTDVTPPAEDITLPNGAVCKAGSLLQSPQGKQYKVLGQLGNDPAQAVVLLDPLIPEGNEGEMIGDLLREMGSWIVLSYEPATIQ